MTRSSLTRQLHKDRASLVESLLLRGVKTLELSETTLRTCMNCGAQFEGRFHPEFQNICRQCIEENVRLSAETIRQSRLEERNRRLSTLGLTGGLATCTFETFADHEQPEAVREARAFVTNWPDTHGLAFLGDVGSGKSHLAAAIVHAISEFGENARFIHWPSLVSDLAMATDWQAEATAKFKPLETVPLLVIDDLGRERARADSAWPMLKDQLINKRWVGGYPLVITANLTRGQFIDELGDAASSRFLSGAVVVEMRPGDRRFTRPRRAPLPPAMRDSRDACPACQGAGWVVDARRSVGRAESLIQCPDCQGRTW